jgi:hypothetical protein
MNKNTMTEAEFIEFMQNSAKENFMQEFYLAPAIAFHAEDKFGFAAVPQLEDEDQKDQVAHYLNAMRMKCDMVIFVTEAWTVRFDKENGPVDINSEPRPSKHPDRKEVLSMTFYDKNRMRMWFCEIIRADDDDPQQGAVLGPWEELSEDGESLDMSGRFADDIPANSEMN